jgi:subtilisin family serine protease
VTASFTPDGSNYAGSFSLGQVSSNNGVVSAGFEFSLGNDQINLPSGQTLTQSYSIGLSDSQNPAANSEQTVSVSIGGPGNDNFVFHPGVGADTILNFNPQHDTIELDSFMSAETVQHLQSLISTDAHHDAVIDLGHGDSITLAGTTAAQLQAILQNAVHLH